MNLRDWKRSLRHDLEESWLDRSIVTDDRDCPKCNGDMHFFGHDENWDFPSGEGYWQCSTCGFRVYEKEL